MPKFKVTLLWRHEIEDVAKVEIEAKDAAEAKKKAELLCDDNEALHKLDWEDGEVISGEYLVSADPPEKV